MFDLDAAARYFEDRGDKQAAERDELRIKREAKARDGYECRCCGRSGKGVEAHHIKPVSLGGPTTLANLVTLCHGCHGLAKSNYFISLRGRNGNKPITFVMSRKVAEIVFGHRTIPPQVKIRGRAA